MRAAVGERKMKARITRARVMTERMIREKMISIMASGCTILVLLISIGSLVPKAAAQSDKYPKMAPVDQYLMERNAEIVLARSAAPDSISSDATVLILGRQGYETAVEGRNGSVCMVERGRYPLDIFRKMGTRVGDARRNPGT